MTVYLTVGIAASGKSSWARDNAADLDAVIVCRDDIRIMQGLKHGDDEGLVTLIHRRLITGALAAGKNVIVADTNIEARFRNSLIKLAHEHGHDVEVVHFPVSLDVAIMRDEGRVDRVGPDVIRKQHSRLQGQTFELSYPVQRYEPYQHRGYTEKQGVYVFDIDGTVADHTGIRSPYDYSKVGQDRAKHDVIRVARMVADTGKFGVVFVSGRDGSCRPDTETWLDYHYNMEYALYMRTAGDIRPDWIIKNEIYDEHLIPKYNIFGVFDDRNQVVRHLRARGITVFQVADGDF
jgi:predicted kinase